MSAKEIHVPHAQQCHDHRHVLLQRRGAKMLVHGVSTLQQRLKTIHTQIQGNGQADGRPQGITPPHPVPEYEHVARVDAEVTHLGLVGGHRHEMPGDGRLIPQMFQQPGPGAMGVGQGLLSGERLGGDDEQGGLRVHPGQGLGQMGTIHVGDEMHGQALMAIGAQGLADHQRPQIRATNPNVHHMADGLPGMAGPGPGAHLLRELPHLRKHCAHPGHDILPLDDRGAVAAVTQGRMQHGTALGGVDGFTGEHGVPPLGHPCGAGQVHEQLHGLLVHPVLGVVQQYVLELNGEALKALRITLEQRAHVHVAEGLEMALQCLPGLGLVGGVRGHGVSRDGLRASGTRYKRPVTAAKQRGIRGGPRHHPRERFTRPSLFLYDGRQHQPPTGSHAHVTQH